MLDRSMIRRSFALHSEQYDRVVTVQKRVVARMAELIRNSLNAAPEQVLDAGCGTGALLEHLTQEYPSACCTGLDLAFGMARQTAAKMGQRAMTVSGDLENLPFRDHSFNLAVSTSTMQWLETLEHGIAELTRVVRPGGLVCLALFGGKTLWELHECYREVLAGKRLPDHDAAKNRLHRFHSGEYFAAVAGQNESLKVVQLFSERETDVRMDLYDLLRSIKGIGAGTANYAGKGGGGGLGWRGILNDISERYRQRYALPDGTLPATYETFYLVARKL